jgi:histidine ammonia-lyase
MGATSAVQLLEVMDRAQAVLAIEALCAAQGLDLLRATTAPGVEEARHVIRERVSTLTRDRVLAPDVAAISDAIGRELVLAGVRARLPELQ